MLHGNVAARPEQSALLDQHAPESFVERLPVGLVQRLRWRPLARGSEEDVVPQQVSRQQGLAARIESFEDDLRIVFFVEINHHDLKRVLQRLETLFQT